MSIRIVNLSSFNKALKNFSEEEMPEQHLKLQKRVALDLLRRIVFRTPVDTGRARGNWQVNLGRALEQSVNQLDRAGVSTLAQGAGVINRSTNPYAIITIFNNVNYIKFLEGGSSQQAPSGMVALSIAEVEAQF
ncbi:MAG: HK97 gp10 family phage protein [Gammaproteobacteria bacterium]|nr:HK97 gp10 family phage protein [Gammaproteobacteria bacterium]